MIEYERDSYELFRRAILHRDEEAWAAIYLRYRSLPIAWAALTPERFAPFSLLAKLLSYLRACVETAALDSARAQVSRECLSDCLTGAPPTTPEQTVLADLDHDALWCTLSAFAVTPAERVVLIESFAYGLPPREICARHPEIFATIANVYNVKRKLFAQLQHDREVLRRSEEFVSI